VTTPYGDGFAQRYDLFHRDKPYAAEIAFLDRRFGELDVARSGRVLELACGTGGHAIGLARLGYALTATDRSAAMLELARAKARVENVEIAFAQSDMREPPPSAERYDAVICLFDSIGYVQTDAAVCAVIDAVGRPLRDGGLLVLEYWHAPAMLNGFDPLRVRRFQDGDATVLRISETELEPERSLAHVTYNVYELAAGGTYAHLEERHTNRYFEIGEMARMVEDRGFQALAVHDGYNDAAADDATWHVLAFWRKHAEAAA
jgi:SAM-dependent methyltransferase